MKILITGFDAFGQFKSNPTKEVLSMLPASYGSYTIDTLVLSASIEGFALLEKRIDQYDVILSLGLANGRRNFTIEQIGINIDDFRIADNSGMVVHHQKIREDGADGYFTTLPIDKIVASIEGMKISYSAGTYICNHVMYLTSYTIEKRHLDVRSGFIHVPGKAGLEEIKDVVLGVIELL